MDCDFFQILTFPDTYINHKKEKDDVINGYSIVLLRTLIHLNKLCRPVLNKLTSLLRVIFVPGGAVPSGGQGGGQLPPPGKLNF